MPRKVVRETAPALRALGACSSGSCWLWPSITQRAYQTGEILAALLGIGRSRLVPEYSFLDPRCFQSFSRARVGVPYGSRASLLRAYQTGEILTALLGIERSRLVPKYSSWTHGALMGQGIGQPGARVQLPGPIMCARVLDSWVRASWCPILASWICGALQGNSRAGAGGSKGL